MFLSIHILINILIILILIWTLLSFTFKTLTKIWKCPCRIILFSCLLIWEDLICFTYFFKLVISSFIYIWMIFLSQFIICLFYLWFVCIFRNPESYVVIFGRIEVLILEKCSFVSKYNCFKMLTRSQYFSYHY